MATYGVASRRAGVPVNRMAAPPLATATPVTPAAPLASGGPMPVSKPNPLTAFTPQALLDNYNTSQNEAKNANETRYNDILGGYGNLQKQVGDQYGSLTNNVLGAYGNNAKATIGGYQDRYGRNMGYIDNAGEQQKKDINSSYNAQNATTQNSLVGQGLSGTTIAPTMQAGNEKARQADLARLNSGILQQKLATDSSLSGDTLGAQTQANNTQTQLASTLGQAGIGAQAGIGQNQLNFQERRNDAYPDLKGLTDTMTNLGRYGGAGADGAGAAGAGAAKLPNIPNSTAGMGGAAKAQYFNAWNAAQAAIPGSAAWQAAQAALARYGTQRVQGSMNGVFA